MPETSFNGDKDINRHKYANHGTCELYIYLKEMAEFQVCWHLVKQSWQNTNFQISNGVLWTVTYSIEASTNRPKLHG